MWCNWFNRWSTRTWYCHTHLCVCVRTVGPDQFWPRSLSCFFGRTYNTVWFEKEPHKPNTRHDTLSINVYQDSYKSHLKWQLSSKRRVQFFCVSLALYYFDCAHLFFSHLCPQRARSLTPRREWDDGIWSSYYESEPLFKDRPIELS